MKHTTAPSQYKTLRHTLGSLFLLGATPPSAILMWHVMVNLDGSVQKLGQEVGAEGGLGLLNRIWPNMLDPLAWKMIGIFMLVQILMMKFVPGKNFCGPVSPKGNVPVYKANGFQVFLLSIGLYLGGAYYLKWYNAGIIYDQLGPLLSALNLFSLGFCFLLYLKGIYAPSSSDSGASGNFIFDYFWGTELYPRIFGIDVKMFTNCRSGMMFWGISILSYAAKQHELYNHVSTSMIVSVTLQLVYVAKFFWWETGYLRSIDIMHDRAGYYICWGCLVWVPSVYTSPAMYLVKHPIDLGMPLTLFFLFLGSLMVAINYAADEQRAHFRRTNGKCLIWGKKPEFIVARYTAGKTQFESLLLLSGWWGIARHFHYVPEILGAFLWSLPALSSASMPYFYVVYLTILLTDRANRDDDRCREKYGADWTKYCSRVPSLILPYLY